MGLIDVLGGIFKPIADVVEHVLPSGDAKIALQGAVVQGQINAAAQVMEYEKQLLDAQKSVIVAEAQGNSWLQRSWRPITMLTFLGLVVADALGFLPFRLASQAWTLLQLGLGGYVAGRSLEKIAPSIAQVVTGKPK